MKNTEKFSGIFPAFYACYDDSGAISAKRTRGFAEYLLDKGVHGLYVGGSSAECTYLTVEERKISLEAAVEQVNSRVPIIAHVACNGIAESRELARHAQSLGVDAIAAIPPIYFKLPEQSIAEYWNAISDAAPNTPFFVYNIPQLAGTSLTPALLRTMLENKNVIGVKNSSMPIADITMWKIVAGDEFMVFNGSDEQLLGGLVSGASGGIGGTYGAMPELFVKLYDTVKRQEMETAREIQYEILRLITGIFEIGNMFPVIKGMLRLRGMDIGEARSPLPHLSPADDQRLNALITRIDEAIKRFN